MIFFEQVIAILWKDIRYELRSKQMWAGMGLFALLVLVIFNFAFDLRVDNRAAVAPGALWVSFVFASMLGLGRTIAAEREKGSMDRLLLCPVDRKAIYLAKLLGNMLFIGVVEIVAHCSERWGSRQSVPCSRQWRQRPGRANYCYRSWSFR
ncbi:MAG: hypothetical protein AUH05_07425 [Ktedonobacter sp. 13_2_20CM_53_11]|nr:MAG: hypothetical protein AUH05_07425 [Ktedonobacter sp. 13_2_20CM_53_11]